MTLEKIKLKELIRTGQKELTVQEVYRYDDLPVKGDVQVKAELKLNVVGVTILGKFRAVIEEPCDRCYEPFERDVKESFEDQFVYESFIDESPSGERELKSEDFYDIIGPDCVLDLKDLIYQHIVLALSDNRICKRETCKIRS